MSSNFNMTSAIEHFPKLQRKSPQATRLYREMYLYGSTWDVWTASPFCFLPPIDRIIIQTLLTTGSIKQAQAASGLTRHDTIQQCNLILLRLDRGLDHFVTTSSIVICNEDFAPHTVLAHRLQLPFICLDLPMPLLMTLDSIEQYKTISDLMCAGGIHACLSKIPGIKAHDLELIAKCCGPLTVAHLPHADPSHAVSREHGRYELPTMAAG